jgi:putative peptide zinc metalloprotease protein
MSQHATGTHGANGKAEIGADRISSDRTELYPAADRAEALWWCDDPPDPSETRKRPSGSSASSASVRPRDELPSADDVWGSDGPLDASAFTSEAMLKPKPRAPESGWRRMVYRLSGGRLDPGPCPGELERAALIARAKNPIRGSRRIAVISRKGGVGKTTTTLMLGHTFAYWRGDRVVALDGNPDAGSLGYRVRRETTATITDLLEDAPRIKRYADIRDYTNQAPSRLEVIASDDDDAITRALGEEELTDAVRLMEHHYNLIMLDTGTGILDSATQGILRMADQIVIVTVPSLDGARAASLTLDWLEHNGYAWLVEGAVAVLNQSREGTLVNVDRIVEHFAQRCRATVVMPWDPHLQAGAESDLNLLAQETRTAYLELAAAVADGFRYPAKSSRG